MGMAHKSTKRMAWNQPIILLFHIHMRGHEMKLSGAMLNIKKRKLFLVRKARPVGLPDEWYCHIISGHCLAVNSCSEEEFIQVQGKMVI